jgi:hypothetical protein
VRGVKTLAKLASGFVFLLANSKFYSHLASWRVVIHTPETTHHTGIEGNEGGGGEGGRREDEEEEEKEDD